MINPSCEHDKGEYWEKPNCMPPGFGKYWKEIDPECPLCPKPKENTMTYQSRKSAVKRWMLEIDTDETQEEILEIIGARLVPHEFGGWVDLKDYESLEAEVERLEKENEVLRNENTLYNKNYLALEAENKRLRESITDIETQSGYEAEQAKHYLELAEKMGLEKRFSFVACISGFERLKGQLKQALSDQGAEEQK